MAVLYSEIDDQEAGQYRRHQPYDVRGASPPRANKNKSLCFFTFNFRWIGFIIDLLILFLSNGFPNWVRNRFPGSLRFPFKWYFRPFFNQDGLVLQRKVLNLQIAQLRCPYPAGVRKLQHRTVSRSQRCAAITAFQNQHYFVPGQHRFR